MMLVQIKCYVEALHMQINIYISVQVSEKYIINIYNQM